MARVQTASVTGVGSTRWIKLSSYTSTGFISAQTTLGGTTATYQIEVTLDETDASVAGAAVTPAVSLMPGVAAASADGFATFSAPLAAVRLTITAGAGTAVLRVMQSGD